MYVYFLLEFLAVIRSPKLCGISSGTAKLVCDRVTFCTKRICNMILKCSYLSLFIISLFSAEDWFSIPIPKKKKKSDRWVSVEWQFLCLSRVRSAILLFQVLIWHFLVFNEFIFSDCFDYRLRYDRECCSQEYLGFHTTLVCCLDCHITEIIF